MSGMPDEPLGPRPGTDPGGMILADSNRCRRLCVGWEEMRALDQKGAGGAKSHILEEWTASKTAAFIAVLGIWGCGETPASGGGGPMVETGGVMPVGGTSTEPESSFDESGPSFDVPVDGEVGDTRCEKVDFLFVIDNSVSMQDEQEALVASFPGFIGAIGELLGDATESDVHIMVTDTDGQTRCTPENCSDPSNATVGGVRKHCLEDESGGYACQTDFSQCDSMLGAGVVHPAGNGASNRPCEFSTGRRYMDFAQPDLEAAFSCAALVGLAGSPDERPMNAMTAALSDMLLGPGGCNEGFLRDDAILVITFISDDPRYVDIGEPEAWYNAVVSAKQGKAENIVVLGLVPAFEGCGKQNVPERGKHWVEFVELFDERGRFASVCEADYSEFFAQAIAPIEQTCETFVPG